jgi:uncharacterized protein YlxW (UPF0749 family)
VLVLAAVSSSFQLAGFTVAMLTLIGIAAGGLMVVKTKTREVADQTAITWRANAEAQRAERDRLQSEVDRTREELAELRKTAPELAVIAHRLELMEGRLAAQIVTEQAVAETIARIHQSLQLVVRDQGERRSEYRGHVPIDPLRAPRSDESDDRAQR